MKTLLPDTGDESVSDCPLSVLKERINTVDGKPKWKIVFKSTRHGIRKFKREHNFPCKNCDQICTSQKELNNHYLKNTRKFKL